PGFYADGEGGSKRWFTAPRHPHHGQLEPRNLSFGQREADQPAPIGSHEVDGFGGDSVRRQAQIAFVLAIFVVYQDHHLAVTEIVECALDVFEVLRRDVERSNAGRAWFVFHRRLT